MSDEHGRLGGLRRAVEQGGAAMVADAADGDGYAAGRLAQVLERRQHRVDATAASDVPVLHDHRDAVEARHARVRRDSRTVAAHDEIFLGPFTVIERLIAGEFEIRAPRRVVANGGHIAATAVAAMNRSYFDEVALSLE